MTRPMVQRVVTLAVALVSAALGAIAVMMFQREDVPSPKSELQGPAPTAAMVERGAYLARLGNCMACHTEKGGASYAGGRAIATPFGAVYTSNLTPDEGTGIGAWTAADFWRAMHHGQSKDGRLLYPAFPYTSYTHVTREDSDAIFAYLRSLPAVARARQSHALRFPYSTQVALAAWRALFFRSQPWQNDPQRSPEWNRGAYLVQGLGHCTACHTPRNALGASSERRWLHGGLVAGQSWYAPALTSPSEAGLQEWSVEEIVTLMRVGTTARGSVSGPMAEVVQRSTQYLSDTDARAMGHYLQKLPVHKQAGSHGGSTISAVTMQRGQSVFTQHCAQCHGDAGEGAGGEFPPLAGSRAVLLDSPINVIQMVLKGGYQPATEGNPRPHGMPPFLQTLSDEEIANVSTFVRNAWGNRASAVDNIDVFRTRESDGY